jgi:lipoate-protein ligase A
MQHAESKLDLPERALSVSQDGPEPASLAMARDHVIATRLRDAEAGCLLRFHGWTQPALSFGRSQSLPADLVEAATMEGVARARRPTGGGWLLHVPGDLAVTLALRDPSRVGTLRRGTRLLAQAIVLTLGELGRSAMIVTSKGVATRATTCFARHDRDEILISGHKVAGIALCRLGRTALIQAALPLSSPPVALTAFAARYDPARAEAVAQLGSLDRLRWRELCVDAVAALLGLPKQRWSWDPAWLRQAEELRAQFSGFNLDRPEAPQLDPRRAG